MTENQIEKLLQSWNPSKDSEEFKEKLWQQIQEELNSEELNDEQLEMAAGGIATEKKKIMRN